MSVFISDAEKRAIDTFTDEMLIRDAGFGGVNAIRQHIVAARARAIAEADQRGIPRRPLSEVVRTQIEADIARLQGR
ncbi:MAG: hypothetical protein IT472_08775 [Thermomonas sp.]|uniref:hypothetical protein n=1 Tax=Thermomonas sp. TaxID=1971895 RepID=UPI0026378E14|nr:hypothetical protein [Thermomonas sp.]MCC7097258.1 hypothetical protein [Thermomonas sp.]